MRADTFLDCLSAYTPVVLGDHGDGIVVVPDMEGRIFTAMDGEIISRVVEEEIRRRPLPNEPVCAGGDVLWVAPEGTPHGYFYATGDWHIPAGLCALRYEIEQQCDRSIMISKQVAVTNNAGQPVHMRIERDIRLLPSPNGVSYEVDERFVILGLKPGSWENACLVPWTLAQYPTTPESRVTFSLKSEERWKSVYQPAGETLHLNGELATFKPDGRYKCQIIMTPDVNKITLHKPPLTIARTFISASPAGSAVDITDIDPTEPCDCDFPARTSVYNSDSGFLELEVCGNSPAVLQPGTVISVQVRTECLRV